MSVPPEVRLAEALAGGGGPLALAESCTGGLVAHRVTEVPGSSAYFDRGVVVYSNRAKTELLGVPESLLQEHGAVSEACARALLRGLFDRTPAELAAAVTGIAGPAGGSPEKPVGTVWV
ncbi:MAG: CinA family protein, partial [Deltaproteobacteria bacterium]|nr:CinA family protein [Deltaproteobacteria bacterium]